MDYDLVKLPKWNIELVHSNCDHPIKVDQWLGLKIFKNRTELFSDEFNGFVQKICRSMYVIFGAFWVTTFNLIVHKSEEKFLASVKGADKTMKGVVAPKN